MSTEDLFITIETCNDEYLRQNPEVESLLWTSWVVTVCDWKSLSHPTTAEWKILRSHWRHNKTPSSSVDELIKIRTSN